MTEIQRKEFQDFGEIESQFEESEKANVRWIPKAEPIAIKHKKSIKSKSNKGPYWGSESDSDSQDLSKFWKTSSSKKKSRPKHDVISAMDLQDFLDKVADNGGAVEGIGVTADAISTADSDSLTKNKIVDEEDWSAFFGDAIEDIKSNRGTPDFNVLDIPSGDESDEMGGTWEENYDSEKYNDSSDDNNDAVSVTLQDDRFDELQIKVDDISSQVDSIIDDMAEIKKRQKKTLKLLTELLDIARFKNL